MAEYKPMRLTSEPASIPQIVAHIQKQLTEEDPDYKPLKQWMQPASIPQIVSHIQKYLEDNPIPYGDELGEAIEKYLREHPDVLQVPVVVGATSSTDGSEGLVPQPLAGDQTKVLFGDGTFKEIEIPEVNVMEGATSETDGESGLVPQPLAGDQTKVLYGDGTFKTIPTPEPPSVMEGATSETDGESGLVPQPLAGDQTKVLYGDGTFKTIPTPEPPSVMEGATASTDGESGLVPKPLAGDHNKRLAGNGTWVQNYDAFTTSILTTDWSNSGTSWEDSTPTNMGEPSINPYTATISATCADGDDIKISAYTQSACSAPLWVYVGTNQVIIQTSAVPKATVDINGIILHK